MQKFGRTLNLKFPLKTQFDNNTRTQKKKKNAINEPNVIFFNVNFELIFYENSVFDVSKTVTTEYYFCCAK